MAKKPKPAAAMPPNFDVLILAQILDILELPFTHNPRDELIHEVMYDLARRGIVNLVGQPWLTLLPAGRYYSLKLAYLLDQYIRSWRVDTVPVEVDDWDRLMLLPSMVRKLRRYRRYNLWRLRQQLARAR